MSDVPKSPPPSRYSRVYVKMWADEKFQLLQDLIKLLWVYLISSPHRNLEALFRCPFSYIAADLGWNVKHVASRMDVLQREGFVSIDEKTNLILLRNALKYQWPEGTNVILGVIRRLEALPKSPLLQEFQALTQHHCGQLNSAPSARAFALALERAFKPPLQPSSSLLISESESESQSTINNLDLNLAVTGAGGNSDFSLSTRSAEQEDRGNGNQVATPLAIIELWNARPSLKHIPKNLRAAASLLNPLQQRCLTHPDLKLWSRLFDTPQAFTSPGHEKPIELLELLREETFEVVVAALEESSYAGQ